MCDDARLNEVVDDPLGQRLGWGARRGECAAEETAKKGQAQTRGENELVYLEPRHSVAHRLSFSTVFLTSSEYVRDECVWSRTDRTYGGRGLNKSVHTVNRSERG